jgi:hypothetical protein
MKTQRRILYDRYISVGMSHKEACARVIAAWKKEDVPSCDGFEAREAERSSNPGEVKNAETVPTSYRTSGGWVGVDYSYE